MMMPSSTSLCWPGAGLGEIAGECGNHQHGLQSLAEQDDSGLNECRRHEQNPLFGSFYRPSALSKAVPLHTTSLAGAQMRERPANKAFLRKQRKLESFNSTDLCGW